MARISFFDLFVSRIAACTINRRCAAVNAHVQAAVLILDHTSEQSRRTEQEVEEQANAINARPDDIRTIVEKLKAWSDSLSPSEQVVLGLLLKRLSEDDAADADATNRLDERHPRE